MTWRKPYERGRPAAWIQELAGKSGTYLIRETFLGEVQYIGESHSGRLKKTLLRHFQRWTGPTSGPTFNAGDVQVAIAVGHAKQLDRSAPARTQ